MFSKTPEEFKATAGYEIDNFWYPRVTKIVEIKSKPALYRFYAGQPDFATGEKMKEISAKEGTLIHETIEAYLLNQNPLVPSSIEPAISAFIEFIAQNKIKVQKDNIEKRFVNLDERYAGTIDAIATIGGKIGILDIKTSQSIYRDYNLQTSAYFAAMKPHIAKLETRWILRIDQSKVCKICGGTLREKGGQLKIRPNWQMKNCAHDWSKTLGHIELQEFSEWENDFQAFLGAKKLWEWENEEILKEIGYL